MNLRRCTTAILLPRVAAFIATVVPEATAAEGTGDSSVQGQMVGVFAGQFLDGMPVYQFPPIAVVAKRKAQLAGIEHEAQLARASAMRTQAALRQPEWRCKPAIAELAPARAASKAVTNPELVC